MKKKPNYLGILLLALPFVAICQEVVTDEQGRRIVVDSAGNWVYFQVDSTAKNEEQRRYQLPEKVVSEHQARLIEAKKMEAEITLQLIGKRVELTELLIAQDGNSSPSSSQDEQVSSLKNRILHLEELLEQARQRLFFLEKIGDLPRQTYLRRLEIWEKDHPMPDQASKNRAPTVLLSETNVFANGILHLPPEKHCVAGTKSTQNGAGQNSWETMPTRFFSHTDKAIESEFVKRDLVECTGYLSAMEGGLRYLNLDFMVATVNAPQLFGQLQLAEFIELDLIDGEKIRLFNNHVGTGQWLPTHDAFLYKSRYAIGSKEEKLLRSHELDKVLVRWSKVQELYLVYELDFLIQQFNCLDDLMTNEK